MAMMTAKPDIFGVGSNKPPEGTGGVAFAIGLVLGICALGLLIGLGVLVALWVNARAFGSRLPILSLALVGLNPMIVRYGDSNRRVMRDSHAMLRLVHVIRQRLGSAHLDWFHRRICGGIMGAA